MSPILNWLQMTLMFSDRIRVAETVCNETENYGKDDNWMGTSNRTYERLEHKREKRKGRENRDKETATTARLGNTARRGPQVARVHSTVQGLASHQCLS